jgi:EAL domain-containing protein (putative c-di-GMP-specific phosphodiesterase class I)
MAAFFMGGVRARTRTFVVLSTAAMCVLIGTAGTLVARNVAGVSRADARLRAAHGVDLLATVAADLPRLTRSSIRNGLSPVVLRRLDGAINRGQHDRLLADLVIWDVTGRIVYSSLDRTEGTRPALEPAVAAALTGRAVTERHPAEVDQTTDKATGVLDGFEPLRDATGVFGAMEISLPLRPIEAATARTRRRSALLFFGVAAIAWLLLMPLWVRLARSQAGDWIPGRRRTISRVRAALDNDAIELVYQPQIDPVTGIARGVEALVRWRCEGELVCPDQFLPAVESCSLMPRLTDRVLDLALAQLAEWRRAGIVVRVSVNLSPTDLADDALPQRIAAKLAAHQVMGTSLTLEVTETAILEDVEQASRVLTALDQMGIDIAVDDFGTGHASIARLHALPVSEVKVDRSFVSDTREHSRTYLTAVVSFGRSLGLRVVAEGVEDAETLTLLATLGCDLAQGYLISRPIAAAAMTAWLTTAGSPVLVDAAR